MPTMKLPLALLLTALLGIGGFPALAQNCGLSGTPSWNSALRNVIADCSDSFISPDGEFVMQISTKGTMSLSAKSERKELRWSGSKLLVPPAMLSWSPESNAFFLNDGDGSGMSSTFRFFRIKGTEVYEDKSIERAAVSFYRRRTHCNSSAADPNVWGFGWGKQGVRIFLLVQPTVNESCGRPDDFIGLIVRISDDKIKESLSKAQMKEQFGSQLPASLFNE
jgi:hypothetical protein